METAVIVLGLAALGGLTLAGIRFSGSPRPPTWMAVGHGLVAATGLVLLIYAAATKTIPQLALVSIVASALVVALVTYHAGHVLHNVSDSVRRFWSVSDEATS